MLEQDDPTFANWDQDATPSPSATASRSPARSPNGWSQRPRASPRVYEQVAGAAWDRVGPRSNGAVFTVATLGRYHLHDVVHHLREVPAPAPQR